MSDHQIPQTPPVLDACCGSRMFWFDRTDKRSLCLDIRAGEWPTDFGTRCTKGRKPIKVAPDLLGDFTNMSFPSESFYVVVFDPPHHTKKHYGSGDSIMRNTYGMLPEGWEDMIRKGFQECFRVLKPMGILIFKWGAREIPVSKVLTLTPHKPLFGHVTGAKKHTHWMTFIKT